MNIKQIFDEISAESGTNKKMEILAKYKDNELLKRVLYVANSKRVKFYIKQIPEYSFDPTWEHKPLSEAIDLLNKLSTREFTGNYAIEWLQSILNSLTVDDAYIIERIIEKDCKIGMGTTNINKVWPDLIEKTGYMGCKPYSKDAILKILSKGRAISEEKMDGRFVNIIIRAHEVEMESRQGEPTILENPVFLAELEKLDDCVLNAELTIDGVDRFDSNGMISSLISIANKRKNGEDVTKDIAKFESKHMDYRKALDSIRVTSWDKLTPEEYFNRKSNIVYEHRFNGLKNVLVGFKMLSVVENRIIKTFDEAIEHFEEILKRGGEGTVIKSLDGLWVDSKPNFQIKLKKEINLDLRVVGFNYGTGKNVNLISSLNVESEDGLLKTSPTGISEEKMEYITRNQQTLLNTIVEIKCSGLSQDSLGNYSVLHPVFKNLRVGEKDVANTLVECIEINKSSQFI